MNSSPETCSEPGRNGACDGKHPSKQPNPRPGFAGFRSPLDPSAEDGLAGGSPPHGASIMTIHYSEAERLERRALGLPTSAPASAGSLGLAAPDRALVRRAAIRAPSVLNEAPDYGSAFSRGLRVDLPGGVTHLLISGTASVGENGETLHAGDFRAQMWRTYRNITRLLEAEGADWRDIVRTTCYLRDIERDYAEFNHIRNEFFRALGLDPFPASTAIQARICRSDLLIEIEALAILVRP